MPLSNSWKAVLDRGLLDSALAQDKAFRERQIVHPPPKAVLQVFRDLEPDAIELVMVFMDPYPDGKHAFGRAIATQQSYIPYTLKMVQDSIGSPIGDLTLQHWVDQGIFLYNASLSVVHGKPGSMTSVWRAFSQDLISKLNPWGFVFFGSQAQALSKHVNNDQQVFTCAHPAAERYRKGVFTDARIFERINQQRMLDNKPPFVWTKQNVD